MPPLFSRNNQEVGADLGFKCNCKLVKAVPNFQVVLSVQLQIEDDDLILDESEITPIASTF